MKLTKQQLKQIIQEELQKILNETDSYCDDNITTDAACIAAGGTWDVRPGTDQMCCIGARTGRGPA